MVYFQHEIASKVVMYQLVIFKKIAKELWKLGEKMLLLIIIVNTSNKRSEKYWPTSMQKTFHHSL